MAKYFLILCGLFIATSAQACDYGYTQSGPNCVPIVCSDGYILNDKNYCEPDPNLTSQDGNDTVATIQTCPKDYDWVGDQCVKYSLRGASQVEVLTSNKVTGCPDGYTLTAGSCKKTTTTARCDGGTLVGSNCVCPSDATYKDGVCVTNNVTVTQCAQGSTLTNGICIPNQPPTQICAMKGRMIGNPQFPVSSGGDLILDFYFQIYNYTTVPTPTVTSMDKYVTVHNVSNALIVSAMGGYKSKLIDPTEYSGYPACPSGTSASGQPIPGYTYDAFRVSGGSFIAVTF